MIVAVTAVGATLGGGRPADTGGVDAVVVVVGVVCVRENGSEEDDGASGVNERGCGAEESGVEVDADVVG